ncbi:TonB-dependent receptor [Brevundimonas sp.]|uniref:TonB-dependent receptor n=1 Tax=Brevundimonas sp. TaxID=1871086 RepID=UPI001A285F4C|nr:TonB-dependent receptor [Brevundimonas sp.]MBJ7483659.1 TonB-dependent receptor [Brevundimonas sp.]
MHGTRIRLLAGASMVMALGAASRTYAQETAVLVQPETTTVEEIIVTAERRATNIQDTPIAITALTEQFLEERGVDSVEDLSEFTPSLQIFAEQVNNESYIIRGIGRSNEDLTTDAGVAVNINDIYISQPGEANAAVYDIARVEVLRGPQGTLYGKNAVGGVINIITAAPTGTFSGQASAELGDLGLQTYQGHVSGPIADGLQGRLAAYSHQRNGAYTNLTTGERANDIEVFGVRGSLRFRPDDLTQVDLVLDYSDSKQDGVLKSVIADNPGDRYILKDFFEVDEFPTQEADIRSARSETNGSQGIEQWGGSLKVTRDLGGADLVWLAGYRTEESYNVEDIDRTERLINNFFSDQDTWSTSQELRLVSRDDGPLSFGGRLHWTVGVYGFHEEGERDQSIFLKARVPSSQPGDPDNDDDGLLGPGSPDAQDSTARFIQNVDTDSYAAFGQATWDLTDRLSATLGMRYTSENKAVEIVGTSTARLPGGDPYSLFQSEGDYSAADDETWEKFTPKVVLEYAFSDDINGYVSYARGFKSGGYNGQANSAADVIPFRPEVADNYELGLKSELFDRRLRVNMAAFLVEFSDLQVAGTNAQGLVVTSNAANARIEGFELEAQAQPTRALSLRAGVSLLRAEFRDYFVEEFNPTITDGPPFEIVDKSGDRLDDVPEYTVSLGLDYDWDLAGGATTRFSVDSTLKGDTVSNQNTLRASDYAIVNARLTYMAPDGRWALSGWVDNITDEEYYRGGGAVPDFDKFVARVGLVADPRTFGVQLKVNFGD